MNNIKLNMVYRLTSSQLGFINVYVIPIKRELTNNIYYYRSIAIDNKGRFKRVSMFAIDLIQFGVLDISMTLLYRARQQARKGKLKNSRDFIEEVKAYAID